jgi:tetratricopeptide (TPR) repeat protein
MAGWRRRIYSTGFPFEAPRRVISRVAKTGFLFALLAVAGCQAIGWRADSGVAAAQDSAPVPAQAPSSLPFPEPERPEPDLTPDAVYSFLVGEIAADRGDLSLAYNHYSHAALLTRDPYAAEQATRTALLMKDSSRALKSARLWVELAPNSLQARQALAHLLLQQGDVPGTRRELGALMDVAQARGEDGFLLAAAVLGGEHRTTHGLALLSELADAHPRDARGQYAVALMQTSIEAYGDAEPRLQRAIELDPHWAKPRLLLAQVLSATGRTQQAREALKAAVDEQPDDVPLRSAYAKLLVESKDYGAALAEYRTLRRKAPKDVEILLTTALVAMQAEDWSEARKAWNGLIESGEHTDEARYFLAQTEELADRPEVALELYRQVVDGPFRIDAGTRLAVLAAKAGRVAEGRERLAQLRLAAPDRALDLYLAEAELLRKHATPEEASRLYDAALKAYPDNVELLYAKALLAAEQGRVREAEAGFKRVLARERDHADALNALGYTLGDLTDRHQEALGYITRALQLKPDTPAFLDSMGWVQYRMGNHAVAVGYLRRAYATLKDGEVAAHLGEVLWVMGEREEAQRIWTEAKENDPDNPVLRATIERFR